jgi:hypothetical protein
MRFTPAPDTTPAAWVLDGLRGFGGSVLSLVPAGFEAYVRVFHPAARVKGHELKPVRWAEIAAANGRRVHAGMQLTALTGAFESYTAGQLGVCEVAPEIGSLPLELVQPLTTVLARHTTTAERCWFAFWDGFGGLRHEIALAPIFAAPHREYHLLGWLTRGPFRKRRRARLSVGKPLVARGSFLVRRDRDRPRHDVHRVRAELRARASARIRIGGPRDRPLHRSRFRQRRAESAARGET